MSQARLAKGARTWGFLAIVLTGCSEPSLLAPSPTAAKAVVTPAPPSDSVVHSQDDVWARVARENIKGFAGFYRNRSGELVMLLADTSGSTTKRNVFEHIFPVRDASGAALSVARIQKVQFNFDELHRAHELLMFTQGGPHTLSSVDIDEVNNRLALTVWPAGAIGEMRTWVHKIGLRDDMVSISAREFVRFADCTPTDNLISDCQRPTTGGLAITNADASTCSLTLNAIVTAQSNPNFPPTTAPYYGFLTAGHCAAQPGSQVSEPFAQGGWIIGYKTIDNANNYYTCSISTIGCHFSDALVGAYYGDISFDIGHIVGMEYPDQPDPTLAAEILPQYYGDYFAGTDGNNQYSYVGATVYKVGQTTGETHGTISRTGVDVLGPNGVGYMSQVEVQGTGASNVADYGDSGSPVFQRIGGAELVGLTMAVTPDLQKLYYSPWSAVVQETVGPPRQSWPHGSIQVVQ